MTAEIGLALADRVLVPVGRLTRLARRSVLALGEPGFSWSEAAGAARAVGPGALGPIAILMAAVGAIAAIQGLSVLARFGAERLLPSLLAQAIVRDFSPAMTALMLASQVGTSFAGELGAMRVAEEVDGLEAIGVDPVAYLVAPRVLALVVLTPLTTALGAVAAIAGAYGVAVLGFGLAGGGFVSELLSQITSGSLLEALLKAAVFGGLVGLLACSNGLAASGGAEGVGRAANRTVVQAILAIAGLNAAITALLLGSR